MLHVVSMLLKRRRSLETPTWTTSRQLRTHQTQARSTEHPLQMTPPKPPQYGGLLRRGLEGSHGPQSFRTVAIRTPTATRPVSASAARSARGRFNIPPSVSGLYEGETGRSRGRNRARSTESSGDVLGVLARRCRKSRRTRLRRNNDEGSRVQGEGQVVPGKVLYVAE